MKRMKKVFCALLAMVLVAGVCVIPTEAKSGVEQARDVQNAINNATDGGTVYLSEDVLWGTGEPIEIPVDKNITIDLNGYKMESLEPYPIFCVKSGAEVTIKSTVDTSIVKNTGMPEEFQEYYDAETMGLFEVQENAKLIIQSGEYEAGDNYFTGNTKGEVILEGGFYNKVPEGTYTIKKGYEFTSANRNGVDMWTISEATPDITPPVIESIVFEQDGKTINKNDQISFIFKGYDEDSEIAGAHIVFNSETGGFSGDAIITPVEGQENTYKITIDAIAAGEYNRVYVEIVDAAGNLANYNSDKVSLTVQEVIIYADVEGEIIVPDYDIRLTEDDISEFELLGNYLKQEYFYIELDGDYSDVYERAYMYGKCEDGTQFGGGISLNYDEAKSTSSKTVYTGVMTINERMESSIVTFSDVEFYREGSSEGEKATFEKKTVKYIKDLGDDEAPAIEKISIDKQGETVSEGTVTITLEVSDNKEIKSASYCYISIRVPLYYISTGEGDKTYSLEYKGNGKYTATVNVSDLYPTEWFLDNIYIRDFAGNECKLWLNTTSPYYFYVEKNGVCKKQVYEDANVIIYNSENTQVTSFVKDLERRSTIQDVVPAEYLNGSQTGKGEFLGWKIIGTDEILTKDSQFLLDNTTSYWQIKLQEVYKTTTEPEPTPKPDSNVTIIEDKKTTEAVKQETQSVVEKIVSGTVANSVVDEKTAENVTSAINSGKTVSAEIVVVKVPESEIAQIEQTAIEEKVTAELGEDAKVQYLDVSVVLMAGNEELGTLNELQEEITITVAIPEELKADGRTYKVIRNHDGVVEVLDTVVNADGTISFKTDRFSTYAIAYADKEETNTNPNPGAPSTDNNKDTNTNTNTNTNQSNKTPLTDTKAPQTGDNSSVMIYVAICLVALAAILVTKKRNVFAK